MGNNKNKEILEIAPTLASLDKQNPFLVPDGYFTSLENRILDAVDQQPILSNSLPIGYFDALSDKVLEKVQAEDKAKIIPFYKKKWLSIAASFIILLGAGYLISTQSYSPLEYDAFVLEIEPEEALDYLIQNENLYLSDLLSLDIGENDISINTNTITDLDNADLDDLLNSLDSEELEDLL